MPVLTRKQELFVEAYNKTGNGYQSVIEAGYSGNAVTLRQTASENLTKPHILSALEALQHARQVRSNRNQDEMDAFLWTLIEDDSKADRDRLVAAQQVQRLNGKQADEGSAQQGPGSTHCHV